MSVVAIKPMNRPAVGMLMLILGCVASVQAANVPDLTGTYDLATLTPLQRPVSFGNNKYLSPEEADEIRLADQRLEAADNEASDPNREAPPAGGDGSPGAAGNVGGYNAFWIDNGDAAFAVDGKFRTSIITKPANGRTPELTPAGKQARAYAIATTDQTKALLGGSKKAAKVLTMTWNFGHWPSAACWALAQWADHPCCRCCTTTLSALCKPIPMS